MSTPSVSVVIPNLHSPAIGAVIEALRQQTVLPTEIIVVGQDCHGHVRSDDLVRFIETPQPLSAAVARNRGAWAARGELLLFIDADCVAEHDLIARHLAQHADGKRAVGGAYAPATRSFWAFCDHLTSYTTFMPEAAPGVRPYVLSGNMSLGAALFAHAGGFDERFGGAAGEDVDFGLRLQSYGIMPFFDPNARVQHHSSRLTYQGALRHLRRYGAVAADMRWRQGASLPYSAGYALVVRVPWLLLLLAPLAGLLKLVIIVAASPFLWRYWYAFPGMAAQQVAWCLGFGTMLCKYRAV